jgi:hypothetical protein
VLVFPEPRTTGRWTFGQHRGRLSEHERHASNGKLAEVHQMPLVGKSVFAGVLAHRRDADAIAERDAAKRER